MPKYRTTFILVAVFFVLLGYVFFFAKDKESKEELEEKASEIQEIQVIQFPEKDVVGVYVENSQGTFELEKRDDVWKMVNDEAFDVNQLQVSTLITTLNDHKTTSQFTPENLSDFGLEEPSVKVRYSMVYDAQKEFLFGRETPSGQDVYVKQADKSEIFTASKTVFDKYSTLEKASFEKTSDDAAPESSQQIDQEFLENIINEQQ